MASSSSTTAASVSSLKCSMQAILDSISNYGRVHSEWSNRAPGLSKDPLLQIHASNSNPFPSTEALNKLAEQVSDQSVSRPPIFGSAWEEHVQFCSEHTDPLPGLHTLRNSVMAELAFLEKFEADIQDSNAVPQSSNAAFLAITWEEALFAAFNLAPLQELSSLFPLPASFSIRSTRDKSDSSNSSSLKAKERIDPRHSAKVDVVAQGGSAWIRIISTRASTLLSEFREAESYLEEESDDESGDPEMSTEERIMRKLESGGMDEIASKSSLIQIGLDLVAAASAHIAKEPSELNSGPKKQPQVQMIFSRLLPPQSHSSTSLSSLRQDFNLAPSSFDSDSPECQRYNLRLRAILHELESKMGIEVVLGSRIKACLGSPLPSDVAYANHIPASNVFNPETSEYSLPTLPSPPSIPVPFQDIYPTKKLNLDLSALIALVSDITHSPFPPGSKEARMNGADENDERLKELYVSNFVEAQKLRRQSRANIINQEEGLAGFQFQNKGPGPHGRALTQQLVRELDGDQFMEQLSKAASSPPHANSVMDSHLSESKVELFITKESQQKFWEIINLVAGERETKRALALFGLDEQSKGREITEASPTICQEEAERSFWSGSRWCNLEDEFSQKIVKSIQLPVKTLPEPSIVSSRSPSAGTPPVTASSIRSRQNANNTPPGGGNSKQTKHTLNALLAGAENGMSTLTTNATSVKWLVKEMGRRERFSLTTSLDRLEDESRAGLKSSPPPFALLWVAHPRSLAERMCTSVILSESETKESSFTPYFSAQPRTESSIKNELLDPLTPKTPVTGDALPLLNLNDGSSKSGESSSPFQNANFNSDGRSLSVSRDHSDGVVGRSSDSRIKSFGRKTSNWLAGPRPSRRQIIKHYPWWPFGSLESAWLKLTSPIAWKEAETEHTSTWSSESEDEEDIDLDQFGQSVATNQSQRKIQHRNSWARHVRADLRKNWLHWILLTITYIAWALGFSFLVKSIWYEASITAADGTEATPTFFGCTSTYWLLNSRCGLDGDSCSPFSSNISVPFRCPSGCLGTKLGGPRAVGDELPAYVPLVVGGGDGVYRGDSFICSAAVHAGLIRNDKGGCGSLNLVGTYSNYTASQAHGVDSIPFDSTFPVSFTFDSMQDEVGHHCTDTRSNGYIFNVILSAFVAFFLRPKRIVYFFTLFCVGFWHINFVSEPRDYPPPIGEPFGDFLPGLFGAYVIWRVAVRFVFPAFGQFPIEREIWTLGFWWIGVLLNVVFANVPLNRLVASDIKSQPGSLTALIIIILVVLVIAVNQVRVIRSTGYLPKYLTLAITGGVIVGLLAAVPTTGLRLHHYIIALALVCFCGFRTRLSLIYCSFLLGMYTNGIGRWGFDGIVQDVATIIGDGITDSSIPTFLAASSFNSSGILSWNPIPSNLSTDWDSFQLLADDVLRYSGVATSVNITETLFESYVNTNNSFYPSADINATLFDQPHYVRLAYYNSQTATLGDFTKAGTVFLDNGTFIEPPPGAT